jgi:hypothetical protein
VANVTDGSSLYFGGTLFTNSTNLGTWFQLPTVQFQCIMMPYSVATTYLGYMFGAVNCYHQNGKYLSSGFSNWNVVFLFLSVFLRTGSELCCFFSITADSFKLWPPVVYDHKKDLIRLAVAEFCIVVHPKTADRRVV